MQDRHVLATVNSEELVNYMPSLGILIDSSSGDL